jgi:hypothetical protein
MASVVPTREQVANALYALLDAAANKVTTLVTSSRRLRDLHRVDKARMPALFLAQGPEHYERTQGQMIGLAPRRTMRFMAVIYTADPQEDSVNPSTQMNALTEAIETALNPDPTTGLQTLGGLVASARIEGTIEFVENLSGDGKSVLVIPIAVLRP